MCTGARRASGVRSRASGDPEAARHSTNCQLCTHLLCLLPVFSARVQRRLRRRQKRQHGASGISSAKPYGKAVLAGQKGRPRLVGSLSTGTGRPVVPATARLAKSRSPRRIRSPRGKHTGSGRALIPDRQLLHRRTPKKTTQWCRSAQEPRYPWYRVLQRLPRQPAPTRASVVRAAQTRWDGPAHAGSLSHNRLQV